MRTVCTYHIPRGDEAMEEGGPVGRVYVIHVEALRQQLEHNCARQV